MIHMIVVEGDIDTAQLKRSSALPAVKSESASTLGITAAAAAARGYNTSVILL